MSVGAVNSFPKRLRARPAFGFVLAFSLGLLLCQSPPLLPESLNVARFAGAVLAGGAAFFTMHRSRSWKGTVPFQRLLLAFVLSGFAFSSLYAFSVVHVPTGMGTRAVSVGLWRDSRSQCCRDVKDSLTCLQKRIDLTEGSISRCWGEFPVTLARLLLVLSYEMTTLAGGASIGLYLLKQRTSVSRSLPRPRPQESPAGDQSLAVPKWDYDLFLSYAKEDRDFVADLVDDLQAAGLAIWWDHPRIGAGDAIGARIEEGLRMSRRFAVVLSPDSVSSDWVIDEVEAARALRSKRREQGVTSYLIPILHRECEVPELLGGKRYADFTDSYQQGLDELLGQLIAPSAPS